MGEDTSTDHFVRLTEDCKATAQKAIAEHMRVNGIDRQKFTSIPEKDWQEAGTGKFMLTEKPRPLLGYLNKRFLKTLDELILGRCKDFMTEAREEIKEAQVLARASKIDAFEVQPNIEGEVYLIAQVVECMSVSERWQDLAAKKQEIIQTLTDRETFLQECEEFEAKSTGDGQRYVKENSLMLEDENKFRKFAIKKVEHMDSEAIALCRGYQKDTGRLFEID